MALTRGGLQPAKLINLSTGEEVQCMFNPFEYTLTKQNSWDKGPAKGKNVGRPSFKQGGSQMLKLTLQFDTLLDNSDVRKHTDMLWKMMMVDETKKLPKSDKAAPPEVAFEWGRLYFKSVLSNMSQKFTMFNDQGTPVRCTVDVTLEQLIDIEDYKPQTGDAIPSVTPPKSIIQTQGDRIDNTAAAANNGDASHWRSVAEANNIDDPQRIPPGTSLVTG